jgi:hypothetical protein
MADDRIQFSKRRDQSPSPHDHVQYAQQPHGQRGGNSSEGVILIVALVSMPPFIKQAGQRPSGASAGSVVPHWGQLAGVFMAGFIVVTPS